MQMHLLIGCVRVLVDVVNTLGIEQRRATLDAMDNIALFQQKLRQIRAILPSNTRDQRDFSHLETFLKLIIILCGLFLKVMTKKSSSSRPIVVPATHNYNSIVFYGVYQPMGVVYTP